MKNIIISIQPEYCELIASGKKTIEVRKTAPKEVPFKVFIYETKMLNPLACNKLKRSKIITSMYGVEKWLYGKIIGEFVCDKVTDLTVCVRNLNESYNWANVDNECGGTCLTWKQLGEYGNGKPLYGYHITALKVYDKPRELGEFRGYCAKKEKCYKDVVRHCNDTHFDWKCNKITRPPQSWQYVETPDWAEEK